MSISEAFGAGPLSTVNILFPKRPCKVKRIFKLLGTRKSHTRTSYKEGQYYMLATNTLAYMYNQLQKQPYIYHHPLTAKNMGNTQNIYPPPPKKKTICLPRSYSKSTHSSFTLQELTRANGSKENNTVIHEHE